MSQSSSSIDIRKFVITSLFVSLTFFLGLTQWGIIPLGFINVTILCIPVIIGTIALGLKTGLLLGLCFGLASTLRAFGIPSPASSLVSTLMTADEVIVSVFGVYSITVSGPPLVILMSIVPRALVPVAAHYSYKLMRRLLKSKEERLSKGVSLPVSAALASVVNTVCYLGLMLAFYAGMGLDYNAILTLIAGTGLIAGSCEAAAAAIISPMIITAIWALNKPYARRH